MSLILHLSDLHLGSPSPDQKFDYSDKVRPGGNVGETSIDHLKRTIEALGLALKEQGRSLDAVVVTGDLTKQNQEDGYEDFVEILGLLGEVKPDDDRIVVVPGNHDVDRKVQPLDWRKLRRFLDTVRDRYNSPLIGALDYDENGEDLQPTNYSPAEPILELEDAVVVGLSSADHCGTTADSKTDWDKLLGRGLRGLFRPDRSIRMEALGELHRLINYDIARVDHHQLEALGRRFEAGTMRDDADESPRLRIAALHHPVGVAASSEEIKPFKEITNLATVRSFIGDNGFHLVLHGHTHESFAGWEWVSPPTDDLDSVPRRVLTLGSPGRFRKGDVVFRLLDVAPGETTSAVAGAPRMRIVDVEGVRPGQPLKLNFGSPCHSLAQPFMQSTDPATPWVVKAKTADAAYEQLRDLETKSGVPRAVISVVEEPGTALERPSNYDGSVDREMFEELIKWWQSARPEAVRAFSGSEFNHGERLYGSGDTVEKAVQALPSSKALSVLIRADEAGDPKREWPAFTAVQLQARRNFDDGGHYLDVVGIYRKQDLKLWWPVNMAELARIQERAVKLASEVNRSLRPVKAGRLVAMAASGVHEDVLPQMAGTLLERAVDLEPNWHYKLAYLAANPSSDTRSEWGRALGDIGDRDGGSLLVPTVGIDRLEGALKVHVEHGSNEQAFLDLVSRVSELARLAESVEQSLKGHEPRARELDAWSRRLKDSASAVSRALEMCLAAGESASE